MGAGALHGRLIGNKTRRGWAWEFLRRNPAFQRDLGRALEQAEFAERRFDIEVVRSSLDLTQWGLLFRKLVEARCECVLVLPPMPACRSLQKRHCRLKHFRLISLLIMSSGTRDNGGRSPACYAAKCSPRFTTACGGRGRFAPRSAFPSTRSGPPIG
ncbi:transcriptional regulator domain-containing protein [Mesorhizobium sp. ORM8.1]